MSTRQKAAIALLFAFANFFGGLFLATYVDKRFIWSALVLPTVAGFYLLTLRCRNCGERVFKRKIKILGAEVTYWGGFLRNCSRCWTKIV